MKGNPSAEWSLVYNSDPAANYQVTDRRGEPVPEVERFLHRVGLRGLAPGSLRTYAHDLLCAFRWLATEALAPSAIGAEALLRFVDYQRSRLRAAPATINRRLQTLQRFVAFLKGEPCTQHPTWWRSPFRARAHSTRISVKEPQTLVVPLTEHEVRVFLESLRTARDRAMAALMWGCGLRASEVLRLHLDDVLFQECALRIHGKGQKQRVMPMAQSVAALLEHYLGTERPKRATSAFFLVLKGSRRGQPLTYAGLRRLFRYHRRRSRILQANPHRFRHTFAANMAKNGVTLPILMKMLGHSDPTVTLRYVCLNDQEVRRQYERALCLLGEKKTAP